VNGLEQGIQPIVGRISKKKFVFSLLGCADTNSVQLSLPVFVQSQSDLNMKYEQSIALSSPGHRFTIYLKLI